MMKLSMIDARARCYTDTYFDWFWIFAYFIL